MKTNPNDPILGGVYCSTGSDGELIKEVVPGITMRHYYAGLAMQGLTTSDIDLPVKRIAELSVEISDALIEALNKIQP